jgi:hypothetical protein
VVSGEAAAGFGAMIRELAALARRDGWDPSAMQRIVPDALARHGGPEAFLRWVDDHPVWRITAAESATQVCAKPAEAAIYIAYTIVSEALDEPWLADDQEVP